MKISSLLEEKGDGIIIRLNNTKYPIAAENEKGEKP